MSEMNPEKKEPWLNQMALSTVIFAVCATLSTFKGGSYSTQSVVLQALASDQWGFYQAKSMKQHLFELQTDELKLQMAALSPGNPAIEQYARQIKSYQDQAARYGQEKKEIQEKAKELETKRDEAKRHNAPFGQAVLILQVAILMSSIAGVMKSRPIWLLALPIGLAGLIYFANGFIGFL